MKSEMFLENKEIAGLAEAVARVFGLHPNSVVFSVAEQKVKIPDPFRDGTRGEKLAQVITFTEGAFLEVVVTSATFLGISAVHRMPYAASLVRCAELLDKPDKLHRVIIDDNLAVLEFRGPLSGWEAARLVRMLAVGWTVEDIICDEADGRWIAARYGYLQ